MNRPFPVPVMTPETKCNFCTNSKCCTYITQGIDAPRSKSDFDHLLWQISHAGIGIYKDSDGWYLLVETRCRHLESDGRCRIYDHRPQVCREYSNDYCEFDEPAEQHFELFFQDYDALHRYYRKRFPAKGRAGSRQTTRPPKTRRSP